MRVDERNGNWFAIEAKSFEITVEGEGKKTKYFITERSRGRASWIRFEVEGLFNLLKGVEECCNASTPVSRSLVWRENGRFFRLESKENKDGIYLLCLAKDVEGKKHRLFFPEGRGFLNGWALLVEKLRGLGLKLQEKIPMNLMGYPKSLYQVSRIIEQYCNAIHRRGRFHSCSNQLFTLRSRF